MTCENCLEEFNEKSKLFTTSCNHSFHSECLSKYVKLFKKNNENSTCPYCRQKWNLSAFKKMEEDEDKLKKKIGDYVMIDTQKYKHVKGKIINITPKMYYLEIEGEANYKRIKQSNTCDIIINEK